MMKSRKSSRNSAFDVYVRQETALDRRATHLALFMGVVVAVVLLQSATCHGQELPNVSGVCAPSVDNRRAILEHEGDRGIWFHRDVAACMLTRLQALPLYTDRISLMDERLRIGDERTALLREAVSLADQESQRASESLEAAVRGRRSAEESLTAWHRSRGLWVAVGVLVSALIVSVTAYALNATRSDS